MDIRSKDKRADFVLYYNINTSLSAISAKKNNLPINLDMQ